MLELESRPSDWRTTHVDGRTSERIQFEPGPDSNLVRLHAAASEYADHGRVGGLDDADGEYCATLEVQLEPDDIGLFQVVSDACDVRERIGRSRRSLR
jgi:hypothetical protein